MRIGRRPEDLAALHPYLYRRADGPIRQGRSEQVTGRQKVNERAGNNKIVAAKVKNISRAEPATVAASTS